MFWIPTDVLHNVTIQVVLNEEYSWYELTICFVSLLIYLQFFCRKLQCSITSPITIHIMIISANRMALDDPLEI